MRFISIVILIYSYTMTAKADVFTFETPSQNIQCSVGMGDNFSDIICNIIERMGPPALPRPESCKSGWGHHFELLSDGPVKMVCSPVDSTKGAYEVAPYGVKADFNGIKCVSTKKGFTCRNRDNAGFFLSRKKQIVYKSDRSVSDVDD